MKKSNSAYKETAILSIGELVVSALTVGGFALASLFIEVNLLAAVLGAILGSAVTILNFFFLSFSVNRSVDKYLALRGEQEMTDEEAQAFTVKHSMEIQNAIKINYIIRTVSMLVTLVVAFLVMNIFNPIAAAIPLLAYRPILTVTELVRARFNKAPNPDNFIVYGDEPESSEDD